MNIKSELLLLMIIGTSFWVYFDAQKLGVKKGKGLFDMGPLGWLIGCLILWILFFPMYIAKRTSQYSK